MNIFSFSYFCFLPFSLKNLTDEYAGVKALTNIVDTWKYYV